MTKAELDVALLKAHAQNASNDSGVASSNDITYQLADLYYQAYELTITEDPNAGYFYLSNAYVYALESDHSNTEYIEMTLTNAGRL